MDNDKLFKLIDAGFTKEEILKIIDLPDEGPAEEGENPEPGEGDKAHESAITPDDTTKTIAELNDTVKQLKETVKAMQEANATGAKTEKPGVNDKIEEAIKSFTDSL